MQKFSYVYPLTFLIVLSILFLSSANAMECPGTKLSEAQLIDIVNKARLSNLDLPKVFEKSKTKLVMVRCLYMLQEVALPESLNKSNTFTIDPFGQLVDFSSDTKNK
ncbi:hypothetical protein [Methylomonas sp. CM2]|uniref:hypothetical protein n=1 Tax=Methylomonas sp. CM2 TaxID=3417647 RepID=UPI003CE7CFE1